MLLDFQTLLANDQTLIGTSPSTVVSTNTIDLGAAGTIPAGFQARGSQVKDLGAGARGTRPEILVQVTTTVASGGAATIIFDLIMSAAADLSSPTKLHSTPAIALGTMVAGYKFRIAIPPGITARYLGVQYTIGGADTTGGAYSAGLLLDRESVFNG
ncbi:MAG: Bbp16 family capsid cement protein [Candidatus Acidiferrales bacterium]